MVIKQFFIILCALFLGHAIGAVTNVPLPANVMGMALLFAGLLSGVIRLKDVQQTADFILKHLALFFVVPTVGIMVYFDLLASEAPRIFIPLLLSILAGLFTAGKVTEIFMRRSGDSCHD